MDLMQPAAVVTTLVAALAIGALVGWLAAQVRSQRRVSELREENRSLHTALDMERSHANEKIAALHKAREEMAQSFTALSSKALRSNSEEFLRLAQENLRQFQVKAQGDMTEKERAIENLLKPIKEALTKTEQQIQRIEHERKEAYGSITRHLETMAHTQQMLQGETRNLVQALRRPEVRGQWGEMTLKRLAELAGMVEHCDFSAQVHTATGEGNLRPDMVVRLPGRREIVVDVKTPLDAYISAVEATDDASRTQFLQKHAQYVRCRIRELATKAYWSQFKDSPDFVVLFIPGDQFLSAALDQDRTLLEDALQQKIILATPTSFVALLRAVAFGWQQEVLAENAEHIREVGADLYKRLATFSDHFGRVGKQLSSAVDNYNKAVGSFERYVIPGARKFTEMGVSAKKPLETLEQLEITARQVEHGGS